MPSKKSPNSSDILPVLESYFATWSAGDMAGYQAIFHANAAIIQVTEGQVYHQNLEQFIAQQTPEPDDIGKRREWMTSCAIDEDEVLAVVTAGYELDDGSEIWTGIDRFTLMRDEAGQWKIICLLWYGFPTAL